MFIKLQNSKYKIFVEKIDNYFKDSQHSIHKARNEIKIINFQNEELVVKSFKIPHLLNKVVYTFFRDSKAKKSYENSIKIINFVPKPIAYLEFKKFGLLNKSYFISENFKYNFTIREPLLDDTFTDRDNIFKAFAKFTYELHQNNIFHLDYSPGNILIKKENNNYIFNIVDINRMEFFNLKQVDRAKNFSKLWADDDILITIASEYKKYYQCNDDFIQQVLLFSNKNKKVKNFKKELKSKFRNSNG